MWLVPAAWLVGSATVVLMGFCPNPYLESVRDIAPPHPYPFGSVALALALITVHAVGLIALIRPGSYSRAWGRTLLALVFSLLFVVPAAALSMHSPPAWSAYTLWLVMMIVAVSTLGVASALAAMRHLFCARSEEAGI